MFSLREDLLFACRILAKKPAWTASAVLALALGIGFNTGMHSSADALLFRPLGVSEEERLAAIAPQEAMRTDFGMAPIAAADYVTLLGLIALFLAVLGVYSLMAQSVGQRIPEIGVRVALGASRRDVLWMVLRRGLILTAVGFVAGLPAAYGVARLLAGLLFGVSSEDPAAFLGVPFILFTFAMLACWLPARRAMRTDPINALRYE